MKHLFTLLVLILHFSGLMAQNEWFLDFGKNRNEVRAFLQGKDYFEYIDEDEAMQRMLAVVEKGNEVEYVFSEDKLVAVSVRKEYATKDQSKLHIQSCLDFLDKVSRHKVSRNADGSIVCHTAVSKDCIYKLFVMPSVHLESGQALQLTSINKTQAEKVSDNKFYYDIGRAKADGKPTASKSTKDTDQNKTESGE